MTYMCRILLLSFTLVQVSVYEIFYPYRFLFTNVNNNFCLLYTSPFSFIDISSTFLRWIIMTFFSGYFIYQNWVLYSCLGRVSTEEPDKVCPTATHLSTQGAYLSLPSIIISSLFEGWMILRRAAYTNSPRGKNLTQTFMRGWKPVSYTHLDVYKRQMYVLQLN